MKEKVPGVTLLSEKLRGYLYKQVLSTQIFSKVYNMVKKLLNYLDMLFIILIFTSLSAGSLIEEYDGART